MVEMEERSGSGERRGGSSGGEDGRDEGNGKMWEDWGKGLV